VQPPIAADETCVSAQVWIPSIDYTNAKEVHVTNTEVTWLGGLAFAVTKSRATFKTEMKFDRFPYDTQALDMQLLLAADARTVRLQVSASDSLDCRPDYFGCRKCNFQ
jgi:hypothetical protein